MILRYSDWGFLKDLQNHKRLKKKSMECPIFPFNELERSEAVQQYALIDTLPEEDYDNITKLAATICEVPISLITMIADNRNYFKSHHGILFQESPRDISFCGHAIVSPEPIFIIEDARKDRRFI